MFEPVPRERPVRPQVPLLAARYGASAVRETSDADEAYVGNVVRERPLGRVPWWPPDGGH